MKIVLIAYACEPNRGSEPSVGWNWAIHLAKYYEVVVITRSNNRKIIESELSINTYLNITFVYYDIPILNMLKKKLYYGAQLYSLLWEYFVSKKLKKMEGDIFQRITFVSTVSLLKLYNTPKPYIMSFCAGGESSPVSIYNTYSLKQKITEHVRNLYNASYLVLGSIRKVYDNSKVVIAVTPETANFIKSLGVKKRILVEPAIGLPASIHHIKSSCHNKMLYAGSLKYWKNVSILVNSMEHVQNELLELDIYGQGHEEINIKGIIANKKLEKIVSLKNPVSQSELLSIFPSYDLALQASSHDSGSMFILEAIACGIPVLFLDTGGPKEIFRGLDYPLKVKPDQEYCNIIKSFTHKINWFYENYESFIERYTFIRKKIIDKYSWENKCSRMVEIYKEILNENTTSS